jgi:outer membrane protein OmpA-like peptidoglycan-associated protein
LPGSTSGPEREDPAKSSPSALNHLEKPTERNPEDLCRKENFVKNKLWLAAGVIVGLSAFAQTNSQNTAVAGPTGSTPLFRQIEISRTIQAIDYQHRSGASKLDFAGTDLMPAANGVAKVNSKRGAIEIKAEFGDLQRPTTFGNEYLTYVLWAISPEGRAVNLGEVLVGDNWRSKVEVTTDLQAFALIVTAEPYYAVRQPSNVIVLENVIRPETKGTTETVTAKFDLLERGGYIPTGYKFDPVVLSAKLPLEFYEARNALRIAQSEGAEQYAGDSYQHAVQLMNNADAFATERHYSQKELIAVSREAVQTAEDSRAIAVKKIDEQRLADEREASANAQTQAQLRTEDAMRQTQQAQSDTAKAQSDMAANQVTSAAAITAAQKDAEQSRLTAQAAQQHAQQADADKMAMRERLSVQLNAILETRDSVRGLIVSMSDVLFDTGKYSLKEGAREKLAKVAGILLAYPGLTIEVGGYTDNVGGDQMNQQLSENRANAVRDYLVQEGVAAASVSAKGYGNTIPVASNDNSSGRQQNRRVELLVAGEAIGHPAGPVAESEP